MASPRSIDLALGFTADAHDPVPVDTNDAGANNRPGIDVEKTRSFEGQHDQTTGSLMSWM